MTTLSERMNQIERQVRELATSQDALTTMRSELLTARNDLEVMRGAYARTNARLQEMRTAADLLEPGLAARITAKIRDIQATYREAVRACRETEGTLASVPASLLGGYDVDTLNLFRGEGPRIVHVGEIIYLRPER